MFSTRIQPAYVQGGKGGKGKGGKGDKTSWVAVQKCFECGKRGHDLPRCMNCSQAYYCNSECQRNHWKQHKRSCKAATAALARQANRERLARAVREKQDNIQNAEADKNCVICLGEPLNPVEVSSQAHVHGCIGRN